MAKKCKVIGSKDIQLSLKNDAKTPVYQKGGGVFAFNLHPTNSYDGLWLTMPETGEYVVVMFSDDYGFGGHGRIYHQSCTTQNMENGKPGFQPHRRSAEKN